MRGMRRGALAVLALCAVVGWGRPVIAGPNDGTQDQTQKQSVRQGRWEKQFERFSKTLNLTADQQEKIKPLFEDQAEQLKALQSDKSLAKQEKQEKVKAIRSATEEKIEPLLTPDQMEKWGQWKQKTADRAGDRRGRNGDRDPDRGKWQTHRSSNRETNWEARYDRFSQALSLTGEQQEKIKPIFQDEATQVDALRSDKSLSKPDKLAKAKELKEAVQAQIKPLLTPEQLEKWNSLQQEGRDRREDRQEWRKHQGGNQEVTWQERFEQLSKTLSLTDEQQEKIKPLFQEAAEQLKAVSSDQSLSKQEKQERARSIRSATQDKIELFLTPDQMKKWGEWKQKGWDRSEEQTEQKSDQARDSNQKTDGDSK